MPATEVGSQVFVSGLKRPPVLVGVPSPPPQTIISVPDQIAEWPNRALGTLAAVEVHVQPFVAGSYMPPLSRMWPSRPLPPHTIIRSPVQTAVWR